MWNHRVSPVTAWPSMWNILHHGHLLCRVVIWRGISTFLILTDAWKSLRLDYECFSVHLAYLLWNCTGMDSNNKSKFIQVSFWWHQDYYRLKAQIIKHALKQIVLADITPMKHYWHFCRLYCYVKVQVKSIYHNTSIIIHRMTQRL